MTWTEKRRASVPGGELAYVEAGDPEAPPVVLLSGGLTSSYLWRHLIPLLSPWMRVIAPDLLGSGDSEAEGGADLGLVAQAGRVRSLLDALAIERFALAGHGHGGGVAQLVALEADVEALVLVDAIAFDAWPAPGIRDLRRRLDAVDEPEIDAWIEGMLDAGTRSGRTSPADVEELRRPFRGRPERFRRVVSSFDGEGLAGLEGQLARLEVPALVLWGEEDTFVDVAVAERLGDALPRASVAVFPGCGHFLFEDAPEKAGPIAFQWLRTKFLKVEHRHEPAGAAGPVVVSLGRRPREDGA